MRSRIQNELRYLSVRKDQGRLSIIGQSRHIEPIANFLRSKGLHPILTSTAVGNEDMLEFKEDENEQNLNMLLGGWKEKYVEEVANPWVLGDPDSNFLYGDDQVGPEKKRAKLFKTKQDAENERQHHGSIPKLDPQRWDDAPEKDLNPSNKK